MFSREGTSVITPAIMGMARAVADAGRHGFAAITGSANSEANLKEILRIAKQLEGRNLVSVKDFDKTEIDVVMQVAAKCKDIVKTKGKKKILNTKVIGLMFYEASTRTRCSFESAAKRLGCSVVSILNTSGSSAVKGETFEDSIRMMSSYCDALVIRHASTGALDVASNLVSKPYINAGDGCGEHPTQAFLDLFTIHSYFPVNTDFNTLPLKVSFVGDLHHGRTVHSLAQLLAYYNVQLRYVAPADLQLPHYIEENVKGIFELHGLDSEGRQIKCDSLEAAIPLTDVLYMTRLQRERFTSTDELKTNSPYELTLAKLTKLATPELKVFHPLPRTDELAVDVDSDPRAVYFTQAENGMYVRMALLVLMFGKTAELWES